MSLRKSWMKERDERIKDAARESWGFIRGVTSDLLWVSVVAMQLAIIQTYDRTKKGFLSTDQPWSMAVATSTHQT